MYVLLIVVCPFVLFILAIVLSVLLRYTDSDCPFGMFKLFFPSRRWHHNKKQKTMKQPHDNNLDSNAIDFWCLMSLLNIVFYVKGKWHSTNTTCHFEIVMENLATTLSELQYNILVMWHWLTFFLISDWTLQVS